MAVPRRKLGDTTIEALAAIARRAGIPMLEAASRRDLLDGMRGAQQTGLSEFASLILDLRERAKEASVDELLRELVDRIRYGDYLQADSPETARDRSENVGALIDGAAETVIEDGGEVGLTPLDHFLQRAMLVAGVDTLDPNADAVTLMTLHNAKGLEFPVVFITGLEDGLFPLSQAFDDPDKLEEERRLFYVGITRAERKLYMSFAETRRRNGELMMSIKSRFLKDIPAGMLDERRTIKVRSSGRSSFMRDQRDGLRVRPDARGAAVRRGAPMMCRCGRVLLRSQMPLIPGPVTLPARGYATSSSARGASASFPEADAT